MLLKKLIYAIIAIIATEIIAAKQEQSVNVLSSLNEHEKILVETCTFKLPDYAVLQSDILGEIFFQRAYDSLLVPCIGYHFDIQFDTDQANNVYAFLTDEYGPFVHHGIEMEIDNYDGQLHIYMGGVIVPTDDMLIPQSDSYTYNIVSGEDGLSLYLDTVLITRVTHDETMYKKYFNNGTKKIYFGGSKSGQIISNIEIKCLNYDNTCSLNRAEEPQRKEPPIESTSIEEENSKIITQEKYSLEKINKMETAFGSDLFGENFAHKEPNRENKISETGKDIIKIEYTIYETDGENFSHKETEFEEHSQFESSVGDDDMDLTESIEDIIDDLDNLKSIIQDKFVDEEIMYQETSSFQNTPENIGSLKTATEQFTYIKNIYSNINTIESELEEYIPLRSNSDKISVMIGTIEGNKSVVSGSKISINKNYSIEAVSGDFRVSKLEFEDNGSYTIEYEYNTNDKSVLDISVDFDYDESKTYEISTIGRLSSIEDKLEGKYEEEISKYKSTTKDTVTKEVTNSPSIISTAYIDEISYKLIPFEEITPNDQSYEDSLESRGIEEEIDHEEISYINTIIQDEFSMTTEGGTRSEKKFDKESLVEITSTEKGFTGGILSEYINSKNTKIDETTAEKVYSEADKEEDYNSVKPPHETTQEKNIINNSEILDSIGLSGDIEYTTHYVITAEEITTIDLNIEEVAIIDITKEVITRENTTEEIITIDAHSKEVNDEEVISEEVTFRVVATEVTEKEFSSEKVTAEEDPFEEEISKVFISEEMISEETTTEEATTEEVTTEEATTEEATTEEATTEEAKPEEATTEDYMIKEAIPEETSAKEDPYKEAISELFKIEETTSEESTMKEASTEKATIDEVKDEEVSSVEVSSKDATSNFAISEKATTQTAKIKEVKGLEVTAIEAKNEIVTDQESKNEQVIVEVAAEGSKTKIATIEEVSAEKATTEEYTTEEYTTEEVTTKVATNEEVTTEGVIDEEVTRNEAISDEAKTKVATNEETSNGETTNEETKTVETKTDEAKTEADTTEEFNPEQVIEGEITETTIAFSDSIMKFETKLVIATDDFESDAINSENSAIVVESNAESIVKKIPAEEGIAEINMLSGGLIGENVTNEANFEIVTSEKIYDYGKYYTNSLFEESRFNNSDLIQNTRTFTRIAEILSENIDIKDVNDEETEIEDIYNKEYSSTGSATLDIDFNDTAIYETSSVKDIELDYGYLENNDLEFYTEISNTNKINFVEPNFQINTLAVSSLEIIRQDKESEISFESICTDLNTTFGPLNLNSIVSPKNYKNFIEIPCCGADFQIDFTTFSQSDLYLAFLDKDGLLSHNLFIESQFGVQTNRNAIRKGRHYYTPKRNLIKRHNTYIESVAKYQHIDGILYIYKDGKFILSSDVNGISIKKVYFSTLQHLAYIFNGQITCL
ncbi:Sperm acrosomal protein [Smittium culicis]|uniref:Sperm acrosomal protein n=1 Tax=Smittium culicis TaxID=133412 RepID=A0A1R1YEQ1_9FUNG|nr:Sperm acrosomal protein [Smittium culicis]